MVKLIKKAEKPTYKTTIWCVEQRSSGNIRKQFTIYGTTLAEIESILMKEFKEK